MNPPILTVTNLKVKLDHRVILDHINLTVKPQDTLAIIGPNGAGKTTLFRALLGLIPYTGTITWAPQIKIGYVPQKLAVDRDLPLTTADFFRLKNPQSNLHEIEECLLSVGFQPNHPHQGHLREHIVKRPLGVLSGGELQRVLIAWSLLDHPQVLLFDEPTAGIDISAESTIYSLLHELQERHQLTIIIISHELQLVYKYASAVLCLNKLRVCLGAPHQVLTSHTVKQLFGEEVGLYHHH